MAELQKPAFRVIINKYGHPEVVDPLTTPRDTLSGAKCLQKDGTWARGDAVGGLKNARGFTKQEAVEFVKKNKGAFVRRGQ